LKRIIGHNKVVRALAVSPTGTVLRTCSPSRMPHAIYSLVVCRNVLQSPLSCLAARISALAFGRVSTKHDRADHQTLEPFEFLLQNLSAFTLFAIEKGLHEGAHGGNRQQSETQMIGKRLNALTTADGKLTSRSSRFIETVQDIDAEVAAAAAYDRDCGSLRRSGKPWLPGRWSERNTSKSFFLIRPTNRPRFVCTRM
jgi:hypothetical protein